MCQLKLLSKTWRESTLYYKRCQYVSSYSAIHPCLLMMVITTLIFDGGLLPALQWLHFILVTRKRGSSPALASQGKLGFHVKIFFIHFSSTHNLFEKCIVSRPKVSVLVCFPNHNGWTPKKRSTIGTLLPVTRWPSLLAKIKILLVKSNLSTVQTTLLLLKERSWSVLACAYLTDLC